ncbi:Uncharacterized protein DBV15_07035 [Temnothorax longispinosus]|uniref:Uncharacterized protein n=1 Tax=Temnothorax longispinosus TaxID=300112 RepID=A0A4S2JDG6_9HYME|nr:Uncharacterized protein DBV15_07035 [Temnothorax longispinosus]
MRFHLHFPTQLFLGQVRPKMCHETPVCSGESTLEAVTTAAGCGSNGASTKGVRGSGHGAAVCP